MSDEKELGGMDYFRIAAALLVIAIHTSPLTSFGPEWDFVFTKIIARIAVPFFLMVSGYFTVQPYLFDKSTDIAPLLRFIKKTLFLYAVAIIICLPVNLYAGHFRNINVLDVFRMVVFDGTLYHLWYLPASIIGMLIVYLASRKFGLKTIFIGSLILYVIGLFGDSYFGFIKDLPIISATYNLFFQAFSYTRNGIFYVPIFLVMGAWMKSSRKNTLLKGHILGLLLSLTLMIAEGMILRKLEVQRHDSMYFALLPCMFFLFKIILYIKLKPKKSLRSIAMWIYILHPLFIVSIRGAAKFLHIEGILVTNSLIHFIAVSICSSLGAWVVEKAISLVAEKPYTQGRAWIEINRQSLRRNVEDLSKLMSPGCKLMPVLKANAYGHGAVLLARELNALKIYDFCVATVLEGAELRRKRIKGEILILGYTHPKNFPLLRRYKLTQTVIDYAYARELNSYGKKLKVQIKIDTGMRRLGEPSGRVDRLSSIFRFKNLLIGGAYTHLSADSTKAPLNQVFTEFQEKAFFEAIDTLKECGCICPKLHLQASSGLINYPSIGGDYARVGIALYGILSTRSEAEDSMPGLLPILTVKARLALVKDLFEGEAAGYDLAYIASKDMKIAVVSIGYADGIPRSLSCGKGKVLVNGAEAPIIGLICMDQMLVDVSGAVNPQPGDIAVIIGVSGEKEVTVYDIAEQSGTITNEVLSRLGSRLDREVV